MVRYLLIDRLRGLAIANVSYGAWQTWWLSTLFMVAAAALLLARRDATP